RVDPESPMPRDDRHELLFATLRVVSLFRSGRNLPNVRREIGKKAANGDKRLVLAFDFVVHRSAAVSVDMRTAKLFLSYLLANPSLDDRGSGYEKLAGAFYHQRKMRGNDAHRAEPCH